MTSTVLDVTVLLLCVSASVVALGAADGGRGDVGVGAGEVADLIATETVTVTYASDEAPNGTRTIHATRAELLALAAAGGEGLAPREPFESEALSAVERGIGPRTRIDAAVEPAPSADSANEIRGGPKGPVTEPESPEPIGVGSEPPRGADVAVAVITHPAPHGSDEFEAVRIVIRRW